MSFQIHDSIDIDAPAEIVWQVLTDFGAYGQWNPFQVECSTTLTPGDPIDMLVQVGDGEPTPQHEVIVAVDPGRSFSYRMKPAPLGLLLTPHSERLVHERALNPDDLVVHLALESDLLAHHVFRVSSLER